MRQRSGPATAEDECDRALGEAIDEGSQAHFPRGPLAAHVVQATAPGLVVPAHHVVLRGRRAGQDDVAGHLEVRDGRSHAVETGGSGSARGQHDAVGLAHGGRLVLAGRPRDEQDAVVVVLGTLEPASLSHVEGRHP